MLLSCKYAFKLSICIYMYNLTVHEWYVNGGWMAQPSKIVV